jgi:hypothetical protein
MEHVMDNHEEVLSSNSKRNFITKSLALGAALPLGMVLAEKAAATGTPNNILGIVNVKDPAFGAIGNGAANDTAAIQAAIDYLQNSSSAGTVIFPPGQYKITAPIVISGNGIHLTGCGIYASEIWYRPTSGGSAAFKFQRASNPSSTEIFECSAKELTIRVPVSSSANNSIGIYAIDQSGIVLSDLLIDNQNDGSVCLRIDGRESATIERIHGTAYIPIYIGKNPNTTNGWLSADHLHISDIALSLLKSSDGSPISRGSAPTDGGAGIYIADGANMTNVTIDGENAIAGGKYGIYHVDTTSNPPASYQFAISGVRREQSTSDGWAILFDRSSSTAIQGFVVRNWYGDTACNGFYMRKIQRVLLENVQINSNSSSYTMLDIDNCSDMTWCGFETNSTAQIKLGQLRCISSEPKRHDLKWPTHAQFIDGGWSVPSNQQMPATFCGTGRWAAAATLPDSSVDSTNCNLNMPTKSVIGNHLAIVTVAATQGGTIHYGQWILDTIYNATKLVVSSGNVSATPASGKLSVFFWGNPPGAAVVQNSLGSSCDVIVDVIYKLTNPFGQI